MHPILFLYQFLLYGLLPKALRDQATQDMQEKWKYRQPILQYCSSALLIRKNDLNFHQENYIAKDNQLQYFSIPFAMLPKLLKDHPVLCVQKNDVADKKRTAETFVVVFAAADRDN